MDRTATPGTRPSTRERFNALLAEWGPLLAIVYFSIFGIVLVGFAMAIKLGFRPEGATGAVGTWGAAYIATQLTKPLRIAATFLITPALGTLVRRLRRTQPVPVGVDEGAGPASLESTPPGER
jgi:hypothetical protein